MAANKWKNSPKFNSPEAKAELDAFAEQIKGDCGIPEIHFGKEGIKKHVQMFFNEQRRYKKRRTSPLTSTYVEVKYEVKYSLLIMFMPYIFN